MSKLTINRILETSRFLATTAGQELTDFITYVGDLAENCIRALRNGLTFSENFRCLIKEVEFKDGVEAVVDVSGKTVIGCIPIKAIGDATALDAFGWRISDQGQFVAYVKFKTGTTGTVTLVILLA